MIMITVSFDTQTVCPQQLRTLVKNGQVLHAVGVLNTRWEDYSALHTAEEVGLEAVEWDYTADDTPGTLELTIWYPHNTSAQIKGRIQALCGVEDIEINDDSL